MAENCIGVLTESVHNDWPNGVVGYHDCLTTTVETQ